VKNKRRGTGERRNSIAQMSDVEINATARILPKMKGYRGDARECGRVTERSRGCRHAGLTDKHNDLMTISYANDTKFYDRGA